ncbi:MAG TPA: hypothetical protein VEG68_16220 [Terriglobales bacterium]|nr:hypothetical protein [Terriglobales bacterium]
MEPKDKERFIDEWVDVALRQRGAVEPRPGLENRVLAALKAERERIPAQTWNWRPVWITLAAMLLIGAVAFLRRTTDKVGSTSVASHVTPLLSSEASTHTSSAVTRGPRAGAVRRVSATPRLEQFPSPQPLSEQERILVSYIQQFPREAVLVAQAQTQLLKQEMIEQQNSPARENSQENP